MADYQYMTEEGLEKFKQELHHLKAVERKRISKEIAEARDKGDLSENAEYHAAKDAQGLLEIKIAQMEATLTQARVMDASQLDSSKVSILCTVVIKQNASGKEMTYTLVSEEEADLKSGKISVGSPIGKGLLGKKEGDVAEIEVPNGIMEFTVIKITIG